MILRRARAAAGLLLAAAAVALVASTLLAALVAYGRAATEAGIRTAVESADPVDRSVLVRGAAGNNRAAYPEWDRALRGTFGGGLGGAPVTVSAAGYAAGWALAERPGTGEGVPYASIIYLEALPEHADLVAGRWPGPGATPVQVALPEPAARLLGRSTGDRIRLSDQRTGRTTDVLVSGVWRVRDGADPYWRLVPEGPGFSALAGGSAAGSSTAPDATGGAPYGPLVVDRSDFAARFAVSASVAWQITPRLDDVGLAQLGRVAADAAAAGTGLPPPRDLTQSATAVTGLPELSARLNRADLVSRSALTTPMLLVGAMAGYCLLLVAGVLAEHRRGETALLRARGAGRTQIAGLAVRESMLIVLPALLLAAPAAVALVGLAGPVGRYARLTGSVWLVAVLAALGCAVAVAAPAARRDRPYVA
ncbi:FtsX-like permease family protein, partial [Actinoplanes sp. NPDC051633]|uniref:FtsX-like permease family protein n=1 Tax=Actinoplanes sp. NPDC051633 TaxID=3155670 RepID=UPI00343C3DB7